MTIRSPSELTSGGGAGPSETNGGSQPLPPHPLNLQELPPRPHGKWQRRLNCSCGHAMIYAGLFVSLLCFLVASLPSVYWFTLSGDYVAHVSAYALSLPDGTNIPTTGLPCPAATPYFTLIRVFLYIAVASTALTLFLCFLNVSGSTRFQVSMRVLCVCSVLLFLLSFPPWMFASILHTNDFGCGPPLRETLWRYDAGFVLAIVGWCMTPMIVLAVFTLAQPEVGVDFLRRNIASKVGR